MEKTYLTKTAEETQKLAMDLLPKLMKKRVILLYGALGSGKTTFVKGIAKALGITNLIKSPTYTYNHQYPIPGGNKTLFHFDLYRLAENITFPEQTMAEIGLDEALNNPQSIILIEWPERLPIEQDRQEIHFTKETDTHRIEIH